MTSVRSAEQIQDDFNEFVYIVSHDLGAPLRHVREFSRMLVETIPSGLTADQAEYRRFIDLALHQIDGMQDALLAYSRVYTRAERPALIHPIEMVQYISDTLRGKYRELQPRIMILPMPDIIADRRQVEYVFTELITNAIKFHVPDKMVRVTVGVDESEGHDVFYVRDNGDGIDAKMMSSVFSLFRKAHTRADIDGIGAGLTIVRRIIERHGGKIWIRNDDGAVVYFTLPLADVCPLSCV